MRHDVVFTRNSHEGYHPDHAEDERLPSEIAPPSKPCEGEYQSAHYNRRAGEKGQCHWGLPIGRDLEQISLIDLSTDHSA